MARSYWLSAILLFATPLLIEAKDTPKQQGVYPFTGKIIGNKVRLRAAPHLEGSIIAELNKDDYIKILDEQAEFYVVAPPSGMKMYVYRTYVFDQTIDASNVNVRLAPSLEAPIAAQLHAGDKVVGKPSSQNPKWIEIDPPTTAKLYVSKEYVANVGGGNFLEQQTEARTAAQNILLESYREAESEMKKPFEQMQLEPLMARLEKNANSWNELPEHKKRAEDLKSLLAETYKSRRLAWLEQQATAVSAKLEATERLSLEEKQNYERRILELEGKLQSQKEQLIETIEVKPLEIPTPTEVPQGRWALSEVAFQNAWLTGHSDKTVEDYNKAQLENAQTLRGVIAPYKASVKKAPGDYVLLMGDVPVAFLYSPFVDLNVVAGKEVSLSVVKRENNFFAYPAYCVIQIKHGNP